jgi:phosphoribosyl 1,2-cyclic phosphodiesterase
MRVKFWGVRGSVPTPGRMTERYGGNTACVEVRQDDTVVILDAGTGIRELGLDLVAHGPERLTLLLSHFHWDHVQGLPFFVPLFLPRFDIHFLVPTGYQARLKRVLNKQMAKDVFPVDFGDLAARITFSRMPVRGAAVGPLQVSAFPIDHPGGALAYRLQHQGRVVIYATDNELDPDAAPEAFARVRDAVAGADLLIADGQYRLSEYPGRIGWGHSAVEHVVRLAREAGVKRLALTHHDPMRTDAQLAELERAIRHLDEDLPLFFAREGLVIEV